MQSHRVCHDGLIYWNAWRIYIGYLLSGEEVGIEPAGTGSGISTSGRSGSADSTNEILSPETTT